MEHDQIATRLRLALEREAARHELSPDGWPQIERRHRRRTRRRAGIAALSVAAAAVVVLAVAAGPVRPGNGPAAGAGPVAPRQFNPLITNVWFGWLPAGESLISGGVRPTQAFLEAGPPPGWALSVYARGQCHLTGSASSLKCATHTQFGPTTARLSEHAPAVGGRRAFWAGPSLIWQYARGGWAQLRIPVRDFSALRHDTVIQAEAIKVAEHLRFGAATPALVFPTQLTGLPSQWRVSDVDYTADGGVLRAESYRLTTGTSRFFPHIGDLGVWSYAPYFDIHPSPRKGTCTPHDPATQNTSEIINGYRVVVKRMTFSGLPQQELCAAHAGGFWLSIIQFGSHPAVGVASLFRDHLRLLGTNPANWTSNPLG
ncbi:MAG TPA: hypothetical protein VGF54_06125 [Streptosporangiaceae bacterium]|jgi:hypothetical protein